VSPAGVPDGARWTNVPDLFFSRHLVEIGDAATLKVALHLLWRLARRPPGAPPAVRLAELRADTLLQRSLLATLVEPEGADALPPAAPGASPADHDAALDAVLDASVRALEARGWLVAARVTGDRGPQEWLWLDVPEGRRHYERWVAGGVVLPEPPVARLPVPAPRGNVFVVYEENIGALTPMLAEALIEAEATYPEGWIEDAIRLAVANNVRRWSYVRAILERWLREGRGNETDRRVGDEGRGRDADGPYADYIEH